MKPRRSQKITATSARWGSSRFSLPLALHELGDLGRKEAREPADALGLLLRKRQVFGHFVDAPREAFQFVAGPQLDRLVETSGADPRDALLDPLERPGDAARQPIGERGGEGGAGQREKAGPPQRRADRAVSFRDRLLGKGRPVRAHDRRRRDQH